MMPLKSTKGEVTVITRANGEAIDDPSQKALAGLDTHCWGGLSDQRAAIEAMTYTCQLSGRLHEVLDVRKTELIRSAPYQTHSGRS